MTSPPESSGQLSHRFVVAQGCKGQFGLELRAITVAFLTHCQLLSP
jgi:hypothetical protein